MDNISDTKNNDDKNDKTDDDNYDAEGDQQRQQHGEPRNPPRPLFDQQFTPPQLFNSPPPNFTRPFLMNSNFPPAANRFWGTPPPQRFWPGGNNNNNNSMRGRGSSGSNFGNRGPPPRPNLSVPPIYQQQPIQTLSVKNDRIPEDDIEKIEQKPTEEMCQNEKKIISEEDENVSKEAEHDNDETIATPAKSLVESKNPFTKKTDQNADQPNVETSETIIATPKRVNPFSQAPRMGPINEIELGATPKRWVPKKKQKLDDGNSSRQTTDNPIIPIIPPLVGGISQNPFGSPNVRMPNMQAGPRPMRGGVSPRMFHPNNPMNFQSPMRNRGRGGGPTNTPPFFRSPDQVRGGGGNTGNIRQNFRNNFRGNMNRGNW